MTPNGAVIFVLAIIAASVAARGLATLGLILALVTIFATASRESILTALTRSTGIVAPLALLMGLVWIGLIGRAPHEIAADVQGSRTAAMAYVATLCLRLFILAFAIQAAFLHFAGWTPLRFVGALVAPATAKKLLVLTLSLIDTILQSIDRARTALIAAGIITRQFSFQNLRNGWLLVQTVWLTMVTIALGRMRDKWPIEGTLTHLENVLAASSAVRFARTDLAWLALALASLAVAIGLR